MPQLLIVYVFILFMDTKSTNINMAWQFPSKLEESPTQNICMDFINS